MPEPFPIALSIRLGETLGNAMFSPRTASPRKEGAFPSGSEPLLAEVLAEANKHCASIGKTLKLVSNTEASGPFIYGNCPKATIIYTCQ